MNSAVKPTAVVASCSANETLSSGLLRRGSKVVGIYANAHSPHSSSSGPSYSVREPVSAHTLSTGRAPRTGRKTLEPMLVAFFQTARSLVNKFAGLSTSYLGYPLREQKTVSGSNVSVVQNCILLTLKRE
ncbi:unnamed protein product [Gongylonema pulchrum]|uniref:Secreted protein n=1 Tax=Gongylonema pulchrum TaxID=637853 RepID=A0A183CXK0_9BILA|nr:unnamed protein product [Gongylonema pulchrum]